MKTYQIKDIIKIIILLISLFWICFVINTIVVNTHIQYKKVRPMYLEDGRHGIAVPQIGSPYYEYYLAGHPCDVGGVATREEAQKLANEIGCHVDYGTSYTSSEFKLNNI